MKVQCDEQRGKGGREADLSGAVVCGGVGGGHSLREGAEAEH